MTTEKRDYSKLRPFDLEAVRDRGEAIIDTDGDAVAYLAGPSAKDEICVDMGALGFGLASASDLRMAPLSWVRASADDDTLWPVYKGDRLYWVTNEKWMVAHEFVPAGKCGGKNGAIKSDDGPLSDVAWLENLTFTPPKVKRQVKLLAYLDADQLFWLRETAQPKWPAVRVPLEDRVAEVEEPAGQEGGAQ